MSSRGNALQEDSPLTWNSPVPEKDFWTKSRYVFEFESGEQFELKVALDTNKIPITKKSPVRPNVFYPESIVSDSFVLRVCSSV